jgi:alkylation response protein AidB-like acyl-CoA dehydrogenase
MVASYVDDLAVVIAEAVQPAAVQVDRQGEFPRAAIQALADAGLLGLVSTAEVGGRGEGLRAAALLVERLARHCASTAMVVCMHYAATAVLEAHGPREVREAIAAGRHLTTLAFSEAGSRSHFWAPVSSATSNGGDQVRLNAVKSWITSAGQADSYVWSSRPLAADGLSTIWLVPADAAGLKVAGTFDGLGLRGNASSPVTATDVSVSHSAMLGEDGRGDQLMFGIVLPWFACMSAAMSVGLMEAAIQAAVGHVTRVRLEHQGASLAELATIRAYLARMRVRADQARALLGDTWPPSRRAGGRHAWGAGGQGVRRGGRHRGHRSGHAGVRRGRVPQGGRGRACLPGREGGDRHGTNHRHALRLHRPGAVRHRPVRLTLAGGMTAKEQRMAEARTLVLGAVAYDPKVVTIWEGFTAWFVEHGLRVDYVLYSNYERLVEALLAGHVDIAWNSPLAWVRTRRLAAARGLGVRAVAMRDTDCDLRSLVVVLAGGAVAEVTDLRGRVVAVGALDSPQATLLPLAHLRAVGLEPGRDFEVRRYDVLAGKHGDHVGGERDAARALAAGEVDAACLLEGNYRQFLSEGACWRPTAPGC